MKKLAMVVFCFASCFCGCVTQQYPKVNPQSITVQVSSAKLLHNNIIRAAASRGWTTNSIRDNTVRCTLTKGDHSVVVDVVYSDKDFSVIYVDSVNMRYDPSSDSISRKYNQWVNNLVRDIQNYCSMSLEN